jgi:tetratricopeptide (TPR) repeat protein
VTLVDGFMKSHPDSAAGLRAVGLTAIATGRYGDARQALDRAQTLSAADFGIPTLAIEAEILQEDWAAARATTTAMLASPDVASHWFGNLFRSFIEGYAGRCAEATSAADRATAAMPPGELTAGSRSVAANMLAECGDPPAALRAMRPALAEAKGSSVELETLGEWAITAEAARQPQQADDALGQLAALGTSIAQAPTTRLLNYVRGRVAIGRHDFVSAISDLSAAQAALSPRGQITGPTGHVGIWFALGQAYLGAGRPKDAEPWFRKVADSTFEHVGDPVEFVRSFFYLGQIHEQLGDQPAAREAYRRFLGYWRDGSIARDEVAQATRKVAGRPRP